MRCLGIPFCLLCVVALIGGSRGARADAKDTSAKSPVMTAEQLARAFYDDEAAAKRKYKDKDVLLEGVVVGVQWRDKACAILRLKGAGLEVACLFEDPARVAKLTAGQKVRVSGTCRGVCGRVVVEGCHTVVVLPQKGQPPK